MKEGEGGRRKGGPAFFWAGGAFERSVVDSRIRGGSQGQVFEGAGIQHREGEKPLPGKLGAKGEQCTERYREKKDYLIVRVFTVRGALASPVSQPGAEESSWQHLCCTLQLSLKFFFNFSFIEI